ncbi:hypothetical protein [Nonomuraea sp. NPDC049141]|uniref:hypothetical protein n=1 Tax=Nonomuraea sp. NPDC049141 TaxID=3155500 RepID=UPI0033C40956
MGDLLQRTTAGVIAVFAVFMAASPAFAEDSEKKLFTFKDPRITESSGLAVSPTLEGVFYTHNDSSAAPTFYAVGTDGRTRATFRVQGAQARDWEAMAASKDPATGRGVLWFADIGDNLNGAWPDVSVYKVMEPSSLRNATLPAVRYRFRYADGARNAEGIMVNPVTGRLFVVSKEFSGSVYQAPKKLRTDRVNVLRKVGAAPIMATDAAYAPDGMSYVIRTYFSATVYRPSGESIAKVSMPELKQAESIAYTSDGKSLLTGSEGVRSPVYQVALPAAALPSTRPSSSPTPRSKAAASPSARPAPAEGLSPRDVLIWLAAAVGATGVIALVARRTR